MADPRGRSAVPSAAVIEEAVRRVLTDMGSANFRDRALGYGKPADGGNVGKMNAVYAKVHVNNTDTEYDVPHKLRQVPVACVLDHIEYPLNVGTVPHAHSQPVRMGEWTETNCRVSLHVLTGSLDNCIAVFRVKGA